MNKPSLLIIGPGYVGAEAARQEVVTGSSTVYALARSAEKASLLQASGIIPLRGDLLHPETLPDFPDADHVLFSAAPDGHTEADYQRLYLEGLKAVLVRLRKAKKILWVSSTSVWGDSHSGWVDEAVAPVPGAPKPEILLEAERTVFNSGIPAVVLRLAGIYGPARNRLKAFREGRWPEAGSPLRYLNLIHRDDAARAIHFLFEKGKAGEVYAGADAEPFLNKDLVDWLADRVQRAYPLPQWKSGAPGGKRMRSVKLQNLGFAFRYPSFREGYSALIESGENL